MQAVAVAAGALPVFWLARAHLDSERSAAALAVAYLLYPPVQWLTASDFHPVSLACPLLLFAWWFLDERRLLPFALCAAAAPRDQGARRAHDRRDGRLVRDPLPRAQDGSRDRRRGRSVALIAALVVVPYFAPAGVSAFESRYGSPSLDGRDLSYLAALFLPLGLLPFAAPLALLPALPELGLNLLSSTITQTSVKTHYAATAIPALLAARVYGVARVGERRGFVAALAALAGAIVLGLSAASTSTAGAHDAAARRALAAVPDGAPVSATNALGAHLSDRRRIFSFPVLREAEWVVVDSTAARPSSTASRPERAPGARGAQARSGWRLVFDEDGIFVFRRRG